MKTTLLADESNSADSLSLQETTTRCVGSATRIQNARLVQQEVTRLLLAVRESLLNDLSDLARLLPSWQQRALELTQKTHKKITKVRFLSRYVALSIFRDGIPFQILIASVFLQWIDTEEADVAQLCAQNIILWELFLEAFSGREEVHEHLARIHHQLRVSTIDKLFYTAKLRVRR